MLLYWRGSGICSAIGSTTGTALGMGGGWRVEDTHLRVEHRLFHLVPTH